MLYCLVLPLVDVVEGFQAAHHPVLLPTVCNIVYICIP
jgi:hypothetical protein